MKTLIVYYSFTNNNRILANYLHRTLGCDIYEIQELNKRTGFSIVLDLLLKRKSKIKTFDKALADYHELIIIGPVWAGKIATPLKTFLAGQKKNICSYTFLSLCGGSAGQKDKIEQDLQEIVGRAPKAVDELWINDLLPAEKKNTIKYTSGYRIKEQELERFSSELGKFQKDVELV